MSAPTHAPRWRSGVWPYFKILDTSMISGMSSEKPALDRDLLIAHIWSAYDVTGEVTMNRGAMCVMVHFTRDMALYHRCQL